MKTYRDTFVQLLEFMDEKKHIRADCIEVDSFSYDIINEFLEYLEKEKRVSISTRNNRLAAIRSFFKYTGYHEPKYLNISTSIREISKKKTEGRQMNYLSVNAMEHFLTIRSCDASALCSFFTRVVPGLQNYATCADMISISRNLTL